MATVVSCAFLDSEVGLGLLEVLDALRAPCAPPYVAEVVDKLLPRRPLANDPFGDLVEKSLFMEVMEAALLGALTLILEPLLSPPRAGLSLLSLKRDAFISLGFGVLKMDLVSLNLALEKSLRTTQMMMNIRARPASTPIIAGSTPVP